MWTSLKFLVYINFWSLFLLIKPILIKMPWAWRCFKVYSNGLLFQKMCYFTKANEPVKDISGDTEKVAICWFVFFATQDLRGLKPHYN